MALTESERIFFLTLTINDVFGYHSLQYLMQQFDSFESIYKSDPGKWLNISQLTKDKWRKQKRTISVERAQELVVSNNTNFVTFLDKEYPDVLKQINSPPVILYYQGNISLLEKKSLGVVGTRQISKYGEQIVDEIVPGLVCAGYCIISGFQKGIDQAAHKATLHCGGSTIAVIGTGLDVAYPSQSEDLRAQLRTPQGLIISEYPFNTQALKQNFPRRNRIISGLSRGVVVVEAALKSGSLITAKYAAEQGRDVYAVPGSIFSKLSQGPHYLIQQGAKCVQCVEDIIGELQGENGNSQSQKILNLTSDLQIKVFQELKNCPATCDELHQKLGISIDILSSELMEMELQGSIVVMEDGTYITKAR